METLLQDIQYGARRLVKRPGFALVAIVSLALGIGANTAIFSLVNTVLLRPFPVSKPDELVAVSVFGAEDSMQAFSYPGYLDFRDRNEVLEGLYASRLMPVSLSREGNNERIWGYEVTGNYFEVLGVNAFLGRTFTPEEDRAPLANPIVVLSYGCWERRFARDATVIGKDILLNGHSFRVIGVTPEGFGGTEIIYTPEIWVPMTMQEWMEPGNKWLDKRTNNNIFATGRLKPGVTSEQAEASLNVLAEQLGKEYPNTDEGRTIKLVPPGFILPGIRGAVISFTWVLMFAVSLVLLIACTNIANLLLARAAERRREIAIRLSLGASRLRLIRQLLTESVLLSIVSGAAGLLLALWIVDLLTALKPPFDIPLTIDLKVDWRVLIFSLAASLAASLIFGLVPALQTTNPEIAVVLKDTSSQAGLRRSRLRSGLVVAQIAISLFLLIAAGLVIRALGRLQTMNPGFEVENGLLMSFDLGLQGYDQARGQQFQHQIIERVESLPGVRSASLTDLLPLSLNYSSDYFYVEGQAPVRGANVPSAMVASVESDYLPTMGIPLVAGRNFTDQDTENTTRVIIVNEAFVARFFPEAQSPQEALGKRVSTRSLEGPFLEIVGVTRDGKYWNIGESSQPFVCFPLLQSYSASMVMIVRTTSDPKAMIGAIRGEVQRLDPNLPLFDVKTMTEHLAISLFPARLAAVMLGSFALLALTLAAIGIYGVTAYSVSQRTREIGIRIALGAGPSDVLGMIVRQGMFLAVIGVSVGLAAAFALTRLMESLLYGVSATDPLTFIAIPLVLAGVALAASFIPAWRAAKVDPMIALRYE